MFILPGILGLVILIFLRPFEFIALLRGVPLLYILFGLSVFGYAVDLRLGLTDRLGFGKWAAAPQLPWVVLFVVWCLVTALVKAPAAIASGIVQLVVFFILFFLTAHGIRTFRAYSLLAGVVLSCSIIVAGVCAHQGMSPFECVAIPPGADHSFKGEPDGRPCEQIADCFVDPPDPESLYRCERAGLFGTTSIGHGRIRYVGVLHDPNEVALVVAISLPFAFVFYQRKKTLKRALVVAACVVPVALTVIFSQSRGAQLVFITVFGAYFIKRYGIKGIIVGAILSSPIVLLGGRSGTESEGSSSERLECWYEGMTMLKQSPIFGVGFEQFTEYHFLTAHNSLVLAAGELGMVGLFIWCTIFYLSLKIPFVALRDFADLPEAEVARYWAMALLSSLAGLAVGAFFLSFTYHFMLWLYMGLSAAFYQAVKHHVPDWKVGFGWRDAVIVLFGQTSIVAAIFFYTRMKV